MHFKIALYLSLICHCGFAHESQNSQILDKALSGLQSANSRMTFNRELQDEIFAMVQEDQSARAKISDFRTISDHDRQMLSALAAQHNHRLKQIISTVGWPGIKLVGIEGAEGMWLLIQHQDKDIVFQKQCLVLLKEAVEKQDAGYREYAYLLDRVRKNESLPQVYGTQWECEAGKWYLYPVETPETLNQRRLEVGLNTIEDYMEQIKHIYHLHEGDISTNLSFDS